MELWVCSYETFWNNYKAEQEQMNRQSDKLNYNLMENINCVNKPEPEVSEVKEFRENSK